MRTVTKNLYLISRGDPKNGERCMAGIDIRTNHIYFVHMFYQSLCSGIERVVCYGNTDNDTVWIGPEGKCLTADELELSTAQWLDEMGQVGALIEATIYV